MIKQRVIKSKAGQKGFALIFAILMLSALTAMGLVVSDLAVMETNVVSADYCMEIARARAWSCSQMFMMAVADKKRPSLKLNNLDTDGLDGAPDSSTVDCIVPGMLETGGAEENGEGGIIIGKLTADLYDTDYSFQMILFKSIGFAGKKCGHNIYDKSNDIFNAIGDDEVANGIMFEQELGITFGPCEGENSCQ